MPGTSALGKRTPVGRPDDNRYGRTVGTRLRAASATARSRNAIELGVMTTPPTITTGTAVLDASLSQFIRWAASATAAAKFRITGGKTQVFSASLLTVYSVTMPSGSGGNTPGQSSTNTYSYSIEFMTDAPKVQLRYSNGQLGYMLEVNDQPVSATILQFPSTTGTGYTLLDFGSSAVRKIRLEFSLANGLFDAIYLGPTYSAWAPVSEQNLRVVTVGDSVDASTGTTLPNAAWQKVAGKLLGWTDVRQVSFGGTGFVTAGSYNTIGAALRVSDAAGHNPDLLVISASQNDDGVASATLTAAALAAFQAYRAALPKVPIVVVGVDAGASGPSAARLTTDTAVSAAFTQWADPNSWWIPNASDPAGSWQFGTGRAGLSGPPVLSLGATAGSGGTFGAGTYFWKVTATDAAGETLGSNEVTATIAANGTQVLNWTAPTASGVSGGVSGYKVYRGTVAGSENVRVTTIGSGATLTYTDTGTAGTGATVPVADTTGPNGSGNRDRYGYDSAHPNDLGHAWNGYRFTAGFRSLALPNIA